MKKIMSPLGVVTAMLLFATAANAQTATTARSTTTVKSTHTVNDGAAEPGRNSFTESQARAHIAKSGFTRYRH